MAEKITYEIVKSEAIYMKGHEVTAKLSCPVNIPRLTDFMQPISRTVETAPDNSWVESDSVRVYPDGTITSYAYVENDALVKIERAHQLVVRSQACVGCGKCVSRCPQNAIALVNGKTEMNADECIWCKCCFGPCDAID